MFRIALSTVAVIALAVSGSAAATELANARDYAPIAISSGGTDRLAMHDDMHKHMDNMKGNMQQSAPAQPGGNPPPADPHANPAKPSDPASPGAAHNPPANPGAPQTPPANPPAHTAQPPANQGMKHM